MPRVDSRALVAVLIVTAACAASLRPAAERPLPAAEEPPVADAGGTVVRVAVNAAARGVRLSASDGWRVYDTGGESTLLRAAGGEEWSIERDGGRLRAVRSDGVPTEWRPAPFVARPLARGALLVVNGRRYRGEIALLPTDSGLLVVNRLPLEDYLRGVLPLEVGRRAPEERGGVEAVAVAARSYAAVRISGDVTRPYDLVGTVINQVYGGADAETPLTDSAVAATAGLVLWYGGRVISAPYHSTCGGTTAAASEVWQRTPDEPFLRAVSDRIPGTDRYYCDPSPRFRWTTTLERATLAADLERYLRRYVAEAGTSPGVPRSVEVDGHTPSGRVRWLVLGTDRGRYVLRGNDIRFVMRGAGGEMLNSTYFSVEPEQASDGTISRLTFRGSGWGHGVGMCQWGAFGRARAGQDFRSILQTYYPGTTVEPLD